jgi:glycosyltransferase involved in cell wall biosynthesis
MAFKRIRIQRNGIPHEPTEAIGEALLERIRRGQGDRPAEPKISVVIPALNEAANLPVVLPAIDPDLHEVLLVDGHSEDGTVDIAPLLHPRVRVLHQDGFGKGNALRAGFAAATGDIIVAMDADGSTGPEQIPAFVGALQAGADFAKGSRFIQGSGTSDMPWHRRMGNRAFVALVRILFGGRYSDLCYGYNAFWRDVLPKLNGVGDGFEIVTFMNLRALKAGLKVVEVASFEAARIHGTAKLRTLPDGWRVLKSIVRERFRRSKEEPEPLYGANPKVDVLPDTSGNHGS